MIRRDAQQFWQRIFWLLLAMKLFGKFDQSNTELDEQKVQNNITLVRRFNRIVRLYEGNKISYFVYILYLLIVVVFVGRPHTYPIICVCVFVRRRFHTCMNLIEKVYNLNSLWSASAWERKEAHSDRNTNTHTHSFNVYNFILRCRTQMHIVWKRPYEKQEANPCLVLPLHCLALLYFTLLCCSSLNCTQHFLRFNIMFYGVQWNAHVLTAHKRYKME